MVTSTHWLASQAGMAMLESGGSAADAAAAAGFVLQVVEPHMCGPGGDLPVIVGEPGGAMHVVCGQGPAPAAATVEAYRDRGLDQVPGDGVLAAVVPGAFGGWLALLSRWGRLHLRDVLAPALDLAERGFPVTAELSAVLGFLADHFREAWPSSAVVWLDGDGAPQPGQRWRLPVLAESWHRLLAEADGDGTHSREVELERARSAWYDGFVAEEMGAFSEKHGGLLRATDLSAWQASIEPPVTYDYHGWTVCKASSWSQGPVLLQHLALLAGFDIDGMRLDSAECIHLVVESMKLAFADREAWYADPRFVDVPLDVLLSPAYNDERRRLIDPATASPELRPGSPAGRQPVLPAYGVLDGGESTAHRGISGEPSLHTSGPARGDTVHLDAVDADGLMISATPSGGWLQSSPAIPALGFCLGSRAQMFWLDDGVACRLEPGKRPRTTLTPSLALRDGRPTLAFGTPGGDQQDQWSLLFFLQHVHGGRDLQAAVDAPAYHTEHAPSSFWPRLARPNRLVVEDRLDPEVIAELGRRGHDVDVVNGWSLGRLTAVRDDRPTGGWARAAATSRGRQPYAVGR
jgi:gamma-glutamyltranspeptidase/glutathione hydrolase